MIKGLIVGTVHVGELFERLRTEEREKGLALERKMTWRSHLDEKALGEILKLWQEEPWDCLCIAETPQAVKAARKLGIPCIGYQNPGYEKTELWGLDWLLQGFEEIDWKFLEMVHTRALGRPVIIGETKRLLIREMTVEDLDALYDLYQDTCPGRFVENLAADRAVEEARTRAYIRYMYGLHQFGMWVLVEKSQGCLIGRAGYGLVDYRGKTEMDFGYLVGKSWQGQGYAKEAGRAVLEYGRDFLALKSVCAYTHPENLASRAVLKRLGFALQGELEAQGEGLLCYEKQLDGEEPEEIIFPGACKTQRPML